MKPDNIDNETWDTVVALARSGKPFDFGITLSSGVKLKLRGFCPRKSDIYACEFTPRIAQLSAEDRKEAESAVNTILIGAGFGPVLMLSPQEMRDSMRRLAN